jgi:hypothetical protein
MLNTLFPNTLYVRIKQDQFRIRHLESGEDRTVRADPPFTSQRMLVGDFTAAEHALKVSLKEISKGRIFSVAPQVVIQPLEKMEGGLCEIEKRILHEIAMGAGASKVVVWVGPDLSDAQVKEKLREN